ncbi:hypothetical protein [Coleofasciculus sp.]|uniref:hypothetical protein n=1 Tax=Coleofasciculus sp. TaxID=3100458 RepID=UPI003A1A0B28
MYHEFFLIQQSNMEKVIEILPHYSGTYLGNSTWIPSVRILKFPSKEVSELFATKLLELGIISIGQYNGKM